MKLELHINDLGISINDIDTTGILQTEGQRLIDCVRETILEDKVTASYSLAQSVESRLIDNQTLGVFMDYYWKFVNYGVKGVESGESEQGYSYKSKKPPIEAMKKFVENKGIRPLSMAYVLKNIIFKKGIKKRKFLEKALDKYFNEKNT